MFKSPTVDTLEDVEKVLNKPIKKWLGTIEDQAGYGWYVRDVDYDSDGGNFLTKILIGKPNI